MQPLICLFEDLFWLHNMADSAFKSFIGLNSPPQALITIQMLIYILGELI